MILLRRRTPISTLFPYTTLFRSRETIDGVIAKARLGVGAVAAIPVADTVKDVEQERITKTVPRNRLWRAQTPQGFPRAMIERARSEERRVGKERRCGWCEEHRTK